MAGLTLTYIRPANVEKFFASILLPAKSFWPHYDALRSNPPSLSFAREPELVRAILPFSSSCSCFAAHFFQYTDRSLCTNIFLTSLAHTNLMSILVSSLKINVCQCGHKKHLDHGSHTSLPLQVLSPIATSELLEFASSTLLFVHDAIFRTKLLLPSSEWPRRKAPPLLQGHVFHE